MQSSIYIVEVLFALIRFAIGTSANAPILSRGEWADILTIAVRHGVAGFVCGALEGISAEYRPPAEILMQFVAISAKLAANNAMLDKEVVRISRKLAADGMKHCVLKGQGMAAMYPKPEYRQTGDIDIWVDGCRKEIISYLERDGGKVHLCYLHTDWPSQQKKTLVEMHFQPSCMSSPFKNKTLVRWFMRHKERQMSHRAQLPNGAGEIPFPDASFNSVYMLHHIFRHMISEGVTLKQIVDYAVLLNSNDVKSETDIIEFATIVSQLGIKSFAEGVMWIMHDCCGIAEDKLPCRCDEKEGHFILNEIMSNDGSYSQCGGSKFSRFAAKWSRRMHYLAKYPSEAVWYVPFMAWETIYVKILHK